MLLQNKVKSQVYMDFTVKVITFITFKGIKMLKFKIAGDACLYGRICRSVTLVLRGRNDWTREHVWLHHSGIIQRSGNNFFEQISQHIYFQFSEQSNSWNPMSSTTRTISNSNDWKDTEPTNRSTDRRNLTDF